MLPLHLVEIDSSHLELVGTPFSRLLQVCHCGGTTVAKALSALAPRVLVIWDGPIAHRYDFPQHASGYCRFIRLMADAARQICLRHTGRTDRSAAEEIEKEATPPERGTPLPLAKLLDEWNWVHITNAPNS
jgi:hypothetical protein